MRCSEPAARRQAIHVFWGELLRPTRGTGERRSTNPTTRANR